MTIESLFLPLLLLEYAQLLQTFPGQCGLLKFSLSLTTFPVLIQNLKEVLWDILRWVKLLSTLNYLVSCCGRVLDSRISTHNWIFKFSLFALYRGWDNILAIWTVSNHLNSGGDVQLLIVVHPTLIPVQWVGFLVASAEYASGRLGITRSTSIFFATHQSTFHKWLWFLLVHIGLMTWILGLRIEK